VDDLLATTGGLPGAQMESGCDSGGSTLTKFSASGDKTQKK